MSSAMSGPGGPAGPGGPGGPDGPAGPAGAGGPGGAEGPDGAATAAEVARAGAALAAEVERVRAAGASGVAGAAGAGGVGGPDDVGWLAAELDAGRITGDEAIAHLIAGLGADLGGLDPGDLHALVADLVATDPYLAGLAARLGATGALPDPATPGGADPDGAT